MHKRYYLVLLMSLLPRMTMAQGFSGSITPFTGTVEGDLMSGIITVVNVFLALIALIAAVVIIFGTIAAGASGDEDAAAKAKNNILYAVIGLIVIGLSAAIVNFVLGSFT